ncbi:MAG: BACON domain-containing protein [Rikenellaceae bacterium]|nr:BACON domain-containing protein [Rikenellaceae bacterium]
MRNILKIALALALAIPLSGCEDDTSDYIKLSMSSFTFSPEGEEEYTVTVDASGTWKATYTSTWITVEQDDSNTLRIGATPTRSNRMRKAQISVTSGYAEEIIEVTQLRTNVIFNILEQHSQEFIMSPYGKYVCGVKVTLENQVYYYTPYILEIQTGEITEMETVTEMYDAGAVSDTGVMAVTYWEGSAKYYTAEGEKRDVTIPEGFSNVVVHAISSDGTIFVGYGRNQEEGLYMPIKWTDNQPEILSMPLTDTYGRAVQTGTMARGCSADGSIIYGSCWDDFAAVYWKDSGSWQYVGGGDAINQHTLIIEGYNGLVYIDVVDLAITTAENTMMSTSGRYMAVTYQVNVAENREVVFYHYPAILDTETGVLEIIRDLPDGFRSGWGRTASDHGHLSFACPHSTTYYGYVYDGGITRSTTDYLDQEFGFMLQDPQAYIIRYAGEGESIMGGTYIYEGSLMDYWYLSEAED